MQAEENEKKRLLYNGKLLTLSSKYSESTHTRDFICPIRISELYFEVNFQNNKLHGNSP